MSLKYQLNSGKIVEMSLAPIGQAITLWRAIILEAKGAGLDLSNATEETISGLLSKNIDAVLNIIGSEYVMNAIQECCAKVVYDGQRFNLDLFEDEQTRADFFPLMQLVAVENIRPFFPSLSTLFTTLSGMVVR